MGSTFAKKWPVPSQPGRVIGGDGAATKNLGTAGPTRSAGGVWYRGVYQRLRAPGAAILFCQSHVGPSPVTRRNRANSANPANTISAAGCEPPRRCGCRHTRTTHGDHPAGPRTGHSSGHCATRDRGSCNPTNSAINRTASTTTAAGVRNRSNRSSTNELRQLAAVGGQPDRPAAARSSDGLAPQN